MSKNDEFCIKDEELCIINEEFCIKNDEFCRRRGVGMTAKARLKAAVTVTKLGARVIEGGARPQDEEYARGEQQDEEEREREALSDADQAACEAAITAGYLDSNDDRRLEGGPTVTKR